MRETGSTVHSCALEGADGRAVREMGLAPLLVPHGLHGLERVAETDEPLGVALLHEAVELRARPGLEVVLQRLMRVVGVGDEGIPPHEHEVLRREVCRDDR